ncbi:MAG: hypothetical protein ACI8P9_003617, partial [Parasphingorhabdus sp.]
HPFYRATATALQKLMLQAQKPSVRANTRIMYCQPKASRI